MSDKNDFDFDDDDFLSDDNEPFDFDEEEGFPSGLGDEFESDMPEIEEEPEERGANRTFIVLAGLMIVLFVAALAVVLFLATRPTGPSDLELTASQVVLLNLTVEAQLAGTSTQNAINQAMTLTAAAWTATPSATLTPSPSDTPPPSDTPTATEFRPTITPTPSQDLTQAAIAQLANGALTLTALAGQATLTPTPAPTDPPADLDLLTAFATQVAFATQQGAFDQESFGMRVQFATENAGNLTVDSQAEQDMRSLLQATQSALDSQVGAAQTAIAFIDTALESSAAENAALATALAQVIPAGVQTQAALGTPFAQATVAAAGTQAALGTLIADMNSQLGTPEAPAGSKISAPQVSRAQQATEVALLPAAQGNDATAAVVETRAAFSTQAAQSTRDALATQAALATQMAFVTPPVFATQAAIATQSALATRQALINMALGVQGSPTPGGAGLEAVNMTATAIAGAFLTATAQAVTPGAEVITAAPQQFPTAGATVLPQTGLFDDVVSGGSGGLGLLALAVVGLVGVIVVSRRLRSASSHAEQQEPEPPKVE